MEERYVRNLGLIKLGTPKNIHGRRKQLASEDLAPDHQAAGRKGRTKNENGAWTNFEGRGDLQELQKNDCCLTGGKEQSLKLFT